MRIVHKNNSLKLFSLMAQFLFACNEGGLDWQPDGWNCLNWAQPSEGIYSLALLSRLDPPEGSSGGFPDGQAVVQQHGAESPHGIPLQEPRDGVSLLHHPGNAGTRKLPHVRTGTLQLQETRHRRVSHLYFRHILRHKMWHSTALTTFEPRMWIQASEYDFYALFYTFLSLCAEVNSTSTCHGH